MRGDQDERRAGKREADDANQAARQTDTITGSPNAARTLGHRKWRLIASCAWSRAGVGRSRQRAGGCRSPRRSPHQTLRTIPDAYYVSRVRRASIVFGLAAAWLASSASRLPARPFVLVTRNPACLRIAGWRLQRRCTTSALSGGIAVGLA